MANTSIFNAFERMWQHTVAALNNKSDKTDVEELKTLVGDKSVSEQISNAIGDVSGQIDSHNSSTGAHTDIRNLVNSKLGSSSEINGGTW